MPMGAGMNAEGIALCWTSADLGNKGQTPRVGIPSYLLIAHLLAQKDMDGVVREARKNKHAGWFTFVLADGHGVPCKGWPGSRTTSGRSSTPSTGAPSSAWATRLHSPRGKSV
jgi:hypothetical protein